MRSGGADLQGAMWPRATITASAAPPVPDSCLLYTSQRSLTRLGEVAEDVQGSRRETAGDLASRHELDADFSCPGSGGLDPRQAVVVGERYGATAGCRRQVCLLYTSGVDCEGHADRTRQLQPVGGWVRDHDIAGAGVPGD